jgi:N-acetylglucosaminyldiphosphoundecaprenol N-acetyl-beta-D-mannosaminyltransferase
MLGAKQEIIESAVDKLKAAFPGVNIAGYRNGYFSREEENEVIELIRNSKSNILLAGLNSPFQEKWLYNNLNRFNVQIVMGVGGSFDVISGKLRRAPHIMQNLGIEWLYRLAQEPWRINRMRDLPKFVINILKIKQ